MKAGQTHKCSPLLPSPLLTTNTAALFFTVVSCVPVVSTTRLQGQGLSPGCSSICLSVCLSIYLSINLLIYLPTYHPLSTYLPPQLSLFTYLTNENIEIQGDEVRCPKSHSIKADFEIRLSDSTVHRILSNCAAPE